MVQFEEQTLDLVFAALGDSTRRDVLRALEQGALSVSELALPHAMSLTGFMKHLRVLEDAGLIERSKEGRVVRCQLSAKPLQEAAVWLTRYERFWTTRLDALGRYLHQQEELTPWPSPPPGKSRPSGSRAATKSRLKKSGVRGQTRKR